jgi:hypothetical protein
MKNIKQNLRIWIVLHIQQTSRLVIQQFFCMWNIKEIDQKLLTSINFTYISFNETKTWMKCAQGFG